MKRGSPHDNARTRQAARRFINGRKERELLAQLYAAVTEPSQWLTVLERMRGEFKAEVALQHVWRDTTSIDLSLCANANPAQMQRYQDHYWKLDPWMARLDRMRAGSVALGRDFLDDAVYRASEFYQDFLRPQGFHWFMTAIDEVPPQGVSVVSFLRSPQAGDYAREERDALQELLPHIRNCLRIQRELDAFRARVAYLETALDQLAPGVLLLDAGGRVIHANAAAEAALGCCGEIGLRGERLYLREPAASERLAAALAGAAGGALARRRPVAIDVRARDGRPALNLLVAPFIASLRGRGRQACTLVLLTLPTQASPDAETHLRAVFGLTTAQARCACLLAEGLGLATIGERLSIARSTLRSHLQQLFAKTGTQRQAALVAVLRRTLALRELLADDSSRD